MATADRFDRFTDRARKVLTLAQDEAQRFNHNYIGTEHLLLGILREERSVAASILMEKGMRLATVREDIVQLLNEKTTLTRVKETPLLAEFSRDLTEAAMKNQLDPLVGRDHELEADRLGAQYLVRAGYDPQAMIKVIGVLKNQELFDAELAKAEGREPRSYHGVFASHPDADTRLQRSEERL